MWHHGLITNEKWQLTLKRRIVGLARTTRGCELRDRETVSR